MLTCNGRVGAFFFFLLNYDSKHLHGVHTVYSSGNNGLQVVLLPRMSGHKEAYL